MIKNIMSCDVCKEDQQKTNGWIAAWIDSQGKFNSCHCTDLKKMGTVVDTMEKQTIDGVVVNHAHGSECAVKMYQRYLSTGSLQPEKPGGTS